MPDCRSLLDSPRRTNSYIDVSGTLSAIGIGLPSNFGPDPNFVGSAGNYIAFGHAGTSEDFIGYRNNTFYFKDSPGGGDISDPTVVVGGNVGIGTTSPAAKLDVSGTFRLGNAAYQGGTLSGNPIISSDGVNTTLIPGKDEVGTVRVMDGNSPGGLTFVNGGYSLINSYSNVSANTRSALSLQTNGGIVGIGTTSPGTTLDVIGEGRFSSTLSTSGIRLPNSFGPDPNFVGSAGNYITFGHDGTSEDFIGYRNNTFYFKDSPGGADVKDPTVVVGVLQITGGSDLAEPFEIHEAETIQPGMVVAIDSERPGHLRVSDKPYDRTVAGIVSGANGINPGLTMGQEGTIADGKLPVALTGRVYCYADASNSAIAPGDLLTTSDVPGHAMRVTDHAKAQGAIIGKAMTPLAEGKGLVLVLVTLQ